MQCNAEAIIYEEMKRSRNGWKKDRANGGNKENDSAVKDIRIATKSGSLRKDG